MTRPDRPDKPRDTGDLSADAAARLQAAHVAAIAAGEIELQDDAQVMHLESAGHTDEKGRGSRLRGKGSIMDRVRFGWRPEDQLILEQIKAGANVAFLGLFEEMLTLLDQLYESVRVPQTRNGIVVKDAMGRVVFERDETGNFRQDWGRLTGQDLSAVLFRVQELKFHVAPKINTLMLDAIYAKHIHDDHRSEAYSSVVEGTIGDREARANKQARQDRYHAFFRFWLFSQGDAFMKELNSFQRLLEKTRDWGVWSQR